MEYYSGKRVLVTGGAGFIGSNLCEALVELGAHVSILDNLSTGHQENLEVIKDQVTFIQGSITRLESCISACKGIDIVMHLAALVAITKGQADPHHCLETNVQGTINVLEAARLCNVRTVVFASTAAIYGNHSGLCSEGLAPGPVSVYGYAKLLGEQTCQLYSKSYGIRTVSLRFFNVYGPRQDAKGGDGVLAIFNEKLKANMPIAIFGDGQQTRDFIHVRDVVRAVLHAGTFDEHHADGQPFNVGTGRSTTLLNKLEELMARYPAYSGSIRYLPDRPGDIKHSQADCSKFKKALEYTRNPAS